jgi:uncharacterized protein (DUF305 family)
MKLKMLLLATVLASSPGLVLAQTSGSDPMKAMSDGATAPATKAYVEAMQAMGAKMKSMVPTNDANKDFVLMMKPHHQAAADMAEAYLKYGTDPILKKMATGIVSSQKKEISEMSAWEGDHGMKGK